MFQFNATSVATTVAKYSVSQTLSFVKLLGPPAVNLRRSLLMNQFPLFSRALSRLCLFRGLLFRDRCNIGLPPVTMAPRSCIRNTDWPIHSHCAVCRTSPILRIIVTCSSKADAGAVGKQRPLCVCVRARAPHYIIISLGFYCTVPKKKRYTKQ